MLRLLILKLFGATYGLLFKLKKLQNQKFPRQMVAHLKDAKEFWNSRTEGELEVFSSLITWKEEDEAWRGHSRRSYSVIYEKCVLNI